MCAQRTIHSPLGLQCTLYTGNVQSNHLLAHSVHCTVYKDTLCDPSTHLFAYSLHRQRAIHSPFCVQCTRATCDPLTFLCTVYTGNVRSTHLFAYSIQRQNVLILTNLCFYTKPIVSFSLSWLMSTPAFTA